MTKKIKKFDWSFEDKIKTIINKNVKTEPYEGDTVNKAAIVEEIMELLTSKEYSLLRHTKD